ncbi:MAG: SatD family protein [Dehalococcoidia bacterium]
MNHIGPFTESQYTVLIGDVEDSRGLPDRAGAQRGLQQALRRLNEELEHELAAPLALTAGDEIQGLLNSPEVAVSIIVRLADELFPVRLIYGLGTGALATGISSHVAEIDGPAFHRARNALTAAGHTGSWLAAEGFGPELDRALSALFHLMSAIRSRWTGKQASYTAAARTMMQKDVAGQFGVSPSVISESLKSASFEAVMVGEEAARQLLSAFRSRQLAAANHP